LTAAPAKPPDIDVSGKSLVQIGPSDAETETRLACYSIAMKKRLIFLINFLPLAGIAVIVSFMYPKPMTWIVITGWLVIVFVVHCRTPGAIKPPRVRRPAAVHLVRDFDDIQIVVRAEGGGDGAAESAPAFSVASQTIPLLHRRSLCQP
jgi:hypothetical protein